MHGCNGCNVLIHLLPTVYVHLRRNQLCLREYSSKRIFQHHFVCISPFMQCEGVLKRCETRFLCVYASVSALRKPDRIEFSLASSDWSICLLFSYIFERFMRHAASVFYLMSCWFICSHLTSYAADLFWMNLFPNRPSLTFSSHFYSLKKMSIDLHHNCCHSKRVFIRYRLVVVSEKNVLIKNVRKLFINEINTAPQASLVYYIFAWIWI